MRPKLVIIVGPTAVGKSRLGVHLAKRFRGEVISADSMQVYKGLDLGTGKLSPEEREGVPHHLIDIASPQEKFSAGRFSEIAEGKIAELSGRGCLPIIVGGTGLYLKAFLQGLFDSPPRDPVLLDRLKAIGEKKGLSYLSRMLERVDKTTFKRVGEYDEQRILRALEVYFVTGIPMSEHIKKSPFGRERYNSLKIGLTLPRKLLYRRIDARVEEMFERGWLKEVKELIRKGHPETAHAFNALGYREVVGCLKGELSLEEAKERIKKETRNYAKRQLTWFRKEEGIHGFEATKEEGIYPEIDRLVEQFLTGKGKRYGRFSQQHSG
jgi:tRNA dimethylallyltransferase